jgi:hypothetical protein
LCRSSRGRRARERVVDGRGTYTVEDGDSLGLLTTRVEGRDVVDEDRRHAALEGPEEEAHGEKKSEICCSGMEQEENTPQDDVCNAGKNRLAVIPTPRKAQRNGPAKSRKQL